jgi:beta-mannosidase
VPGDLLTDLQRAGVIGDPLYELNFKSKLWDTGLWTYTTEFTLNADVDPAAAAAVLLVMDGIKMAANVSLNGQPVASSQDQFLRLVVDVKAMLSAAPGATQTLSVVFPPSADPMNDDNRFM